MAYEYLRKFLTGEYQWDLVRPRASRENIDIFNLPKEPQVEGMIEDSWPARAMGSAEYLWDMPILQCSFDEVRFPLCQPYEESLSYALTLLNHEDGTPTDVNIEELADQVYQYLWWHLAIHCGFLLQHYR